MKTKNLKLSIKTRIILIFMAVIVLMGAFNIISLMTSLSYHSRYNGMVANITQANSINGIAKANIDMAMWDIVAGKTEFDEGRPYQLIDDLKSKIESIMKNVRSAENRTKLVVTLRTIETLEHYVDMMGEQIRDKKPVADNEAVLEEIRSVTELIEEDIQEFVLYEIKDSEVVAQSIQENIRHWVAINIIVLILVLAFSIAAGIAISNSIAKPINELKEMSSAIAQGDFNVRIENNQIPEIDSLSRNFNRMARDLQDLIETNKQEQINLKKSELKLLQAQINPHFLYNTFDTIAWLAEGNRNEQVVEMVKAFSQFFRISLSKGRDFITVAEERSHILSYLTIQKIRYQDILEFEIRIESAMDQQRILKLILQPLVENAIYHGIKMKRGLGRISVTGEQADQRTMRFIVQDNGAGMSPDRIQELERVLAGGLELKDPENGFGLANVQKRLQLYYGGDYGLKIESESGVGTRIMFDIPMEGAQG